MVGTSDGEKWMQQWIKMNDIRSIHYIYIPLGGHLFSHNKYSNIWNYFAIIIYGGKYVKEHRIACLVKMNPASWLREN